MKENILIALIAIGYAAWLGVFIVWPLVWGLVQIADLIV